MDTGKEAELCLDQMKSTFFSVHDALPFLMAHTASRDECLNLINGYNSARDAYYFALAKNLIIDDPSMSYILNQLKTSKDIIDNCLNKVEKIKELSEAVSNAIQYIVKFAAIIA